MLDEGGLLLEAITQLIQRHLHLLQPFVLA